MSTVAGCTTTMESPTCKSRAQHVHQRTNTLNSKLVMDASQRQPDWHFFFDSFALMFLNRLVDLGHLGRNASPQQSPSNTIAPQLQINPPLT